VAGGRGSRGRSRPRARAASVAAAPARAPAGDRLELSRLAPSGRSVLVGLAILLLALGGYGIARSTSAFAVDGIAVHGAPVDAAAEVRRTLAHVEGRSLLELDVADLERAVEAIPSVADVAFDRGFPHTLNVHVTPELPVAVARQGTAAWLVASSGRVIAPLDRGERPGLPRLWLPRAVELGAGFALAGAPLRAARAVAPVEGGKLPRVASVRSSEQELTLVLRSGVELRLGDLSDRLLKLTIARRILPSVPAGGYVDVSVPERPVAADTLQPQVEVEGTTSTTT
jgi:cell division septal protein FtsQ